LLAGSFESSVVTALKGGFDLSGCGSCNCNSEESTDETSGESEDGVFHDLFEVVGLEFEG